MYSLTYSESEVMTYGARTLQYQRYSKWNLNITFYSGFLYHGLIQPLLKNRGKLDFSHFSDLTTQVNKSRQSTWWNFFFSLLFRSFIKTNITDVTWCYSFMDATIITTNSMDDSSCVNLEFEDHILFCLIDIPSMIY